MKSKVLKLQMVVSLLYVITLPSNDLIVKLLGYLFIVLSLALPFDLLLCSGGKLNKKQTNLIVALLIITILNSIPSGLNLNSSEWEEAIKAFISFFSFLLAISVTAVECNDSDIAFYFVINRLLSCVYILYTVLPFSFRYVSINDYGGIQFTLSMGNPNATATRVMFCVCLLLIQLVYLKGFWSKAFNFILIAGLTYTLVMLQCRAAFLCCIIGAVLMLFKTKMNAKFLNVAWLIPVVFIALQLVIENVPELLLLNKSLMTGREEMYSDYIYEISLFPEKFVFGSFINNRFGNLHNILFSILYNTGIIGIILYLCYWRIEHKQVAEPGRNRLVNIATICLFMFIMQSSAESATMSGALSYGFMVVLLCRLRKDSISVAVDLKKQEDESLR